MFKNQEVMNDIKEVKKKNEVLIISDNLEKCLKELIYTDLNDESDKRAYAINYHAQIEQIRKDKNAGVLNYSEYSIARSRVRASIQELNTNLHATDLKSFGTLQEQITEKILVISVSMPKKQAEMRRFFSDTYYPNVQFLHYGQPLPNESFDIILLEDMPTGSVSESDMEAYLKQPHPYFLYYGSGFFPKHLQELYDKNKDRVYFANSRFSLYAQLKELLDYIKYYGK